MLRVVLDVNVLVSAIIAPLGIPRHLWLAWQQGRFTLITSDHIILVTAAKLQQSPIARRYTISPDSVRRLELTLRTEAIVVPVLPADIRSVTGDPEDDAVLATARLSGADLLVTGDRGLLALQRHEATRIVTPREFLDLLDA